MTKEELLARLNDIEWNDFEVKEASGGLPKSMWETVSAFSNTEGGWIILGVKEKKTAEGSVYVINGVPNPEQMEQDIVMWEGPDIFGVEDNSQLFCLREGLVNFCAHSDYFASAHPTIRVFDDRIVMQNPGRFILDAGEFRSRVLSMPRNPSIIRLFRHPKLSENAGYGIDKILGWKKLTGKTVTFESDILISTVTYPLASTKDSRNAGENGENNDEIEKQSTRERLVALIKENPRITRASLSEQLGISSSNVQFHIERLKSEGDYQAYWFSQKRTLGIPI